MLIYFFQVIKPLKRQSQQMLSNFVICLNVLEASCSNSVDQSIRSTLFAFVLKLVNNISNYLQQMTSADIIFDGALMIFFTNFVLFGGLDLELWVYTACPSTKGLRFQ